VTLTTARRIANVGATARLETTLLHLRAVCDAVWESDGGAEIPPILRSSALRDSSAADIIRALHLIAQDASDRSLVVHEAVRYAMAEYFSVSTVIAAIIDVQDEFPEAIAALVESFTVILSGVQELLSTTRLFALHRDVYLAFYFDPPLGIYRRSCIDNIRPPLSDAQHELAHVLGEDWVGSFRSLVTTVKSLRPTNPAYGTGAT
jgi:hypothetical protein